MKLFSFFLPQFHEIPENNKWWGEGFTEWTNVKTARPLYRGHVQPRHPINNNYYNLLDKETMVYQTELMKNYKLSGMIYYHYYFKGKLLLEKPAENLLRWKDICQPFFFCWANHSWINSWNGEKKTLIKQSYGAETDWEEHFQYLLPFFRDERYETKANMPLFMIFDSNFLKKDEMFKYFDMRCRDYGFDGLYLIESFNPDQGGNCLYDNYNIFKAKCASVTKDIYLREPITGQAGYHSSLKIDVASKVFRKIKKEIGKINGKSYVYVFDGNKIYKVMIDVCSKLSGIHGAFFGWDNTPRHGRRGYVITPPTKESFFEYMNTIKNEEYVFINAWNEWCEGMMLEPTVEDETKYLEWIFEWKQKKVL